MSLLLVLVGVNLVCLAVLDRIWHLVNVLCKMRRVQAFAFDLRVSCKDALLTFHPNCHEVVLWAWNVLLSRCWDWSLGSHSIFLITVNLQVHKVLRFLKRLLPFWLQRLLTLSVRLYVATLWTKWFLFLVVWISIHCLIELLWDIINYLTSKIVAGWLRLCLCRLRYLLLNLLAERSLF